MFLFHGSLHLVLLLTIISSAFFSYKRLSEFIYSQFMQHMEFSAIIYTLS